MDLGFLQFERYRFRWIMVLAATGSAIGFSNVINFPGLVGKHGGGAFLLIYLLCKLCVAIPVIMAEMALGRRTRQSPSHGMEMLAVDSHRTLRWRWLGKLSMVAGLMILAVYSVVFSWSFAYLTQLVNLDAQQGEDFFYRLFLELMSRPELGAFYQLLFIGILVVIVGTGIRRGIQAGVVVFVPLLLVCALLLGGYSAMNEGFVAALDKVFMPRWQDLSWSAVLSAIQHAFFTLGVGVGAVWAYSSFMDRDQSIGRTGIAVAVIDLIVSLLVALFVWGSLLTNGHEPVSGANLLFQQLPGLVPINWSVVFFLFMVLSGITSSIFLMEPSVQWLMEWRRISRLSAVLMVAIVVLLMGLLAQLSFSLLAEVYWYGRNFYENLVFLSSGLLVPIAGFGTALFVGWFMHPSEVHQEIRPSHPVRYATWLWSLRFISILAIGLVFFAALEQYLGLQMQVSLAIVVSSLFLAFALRRVLRDART